MCVTERASRIRGEKRGDDVSLLDRAPSRPGHDEMPPVPVRQRVPAAL